MRFDTFDMVKKWYDDTKPIISKNHDVRCDIRPIGERRYKWERIVKVSDTKYAVVDGSWTGFNYSHEADEALEFNRTLADKFAPILWEKRDDGEYIHIRGCVNSGYSISRYKMLNYNLPWTLRHTDQQPAGKHWIIDSTGEGKKYQLVKMKGKIAWNQHEITDYEDNSLVFKREVGADGKTVGWTRIGEVKTIGTTINTERKKQLKPALKSFYDWMTTMRPLIPTGWEANNEFSKLMAEGLGIANFWGGRSADQVTPAFAEAVITDEESPYRLAFASVLLRWIEVRECPNKHRDIWVPKYEGQRYMGGEWVHGAPFTEEDTAAWYVKENKRIKAAYNRYMNKMLGLFNEVTV